MIYRDFRGEDVLVEFLRESTTFLTIGITIGANFIAVLIKLPILILFAPDCILLVSKFPNSVQFKPFVAL